MRKPKQPLPADRIIQSLEELISDYDKNQLASALSGLKNDLGWKVLRAAMVKEYQSQVVYAMDHASKSGEQIEAAFRTGCAQTLIDIATTLIDKYEDVLRGRTKVVENARPEE